MKKMVKRLGVLLLIFCLTLTAVACSDTAETGKSSTGSGGGQVEEKGSYTSPEDVAAYIREFGKLPQNYITKKKAQAEGWDSKAGNLWEVTDQKSIGGDKFGNYDKKLPTAKKRQYYECDVNYKGGHRGAERIVYSNDGLIYYTNDHYETFKEMT